VVDGDSMGPGLQLFGARFLNSLLRKLSQEFKLRPMSIFHEIQMVISVLRNATVTWLGTLVVLHVLCMLIDPIQGQGQRHGAFELPTIAIIAHFYIYLLRHFRVQLKTDG